MRSTTLAAWLNTLPTVQSILGSLFNGSPISEVNLTHWRQGGYLQWLTERECFDSARALADGDCDLAKTGLSAERLLNILTLRSGELLMRWDFSPDEDVSEAVAFAAMAKKARILQGISRSVLAIHRIQSQSARTKSSAATSSESRDRGMPSGAQERGAPSNSHNSPEQDATMNLVTDAHPVKAGAAIRLPKSKMSQILTGPIAPPNLSHIPFKPDSDLSEILDAV